MTFKPSQVRAFQKGIDVARSLTADLEFFRKIADIDPAMAPKVRELEELADWVQQVCGCGLAACGDTAV